MSDESIAADAAIDGDAVLRSHDVAEFAGTTPRALRHYHQIGLCCQRCPATRTATGATAPATS